MHSVATEITLLIQNKKAWPTAVMTQLTALCSVMVQYAIWRQHCNHHHTNFISYVMILESRISYVKNTIYIYNHFDIPISCTRAHQGH